jgi:hypothetical protein
MPQMNKRLFLYSILIFLASLFCISAQTQDAERLVYVCVDPTDTDAAPYLITFRNTDIVGLIPSENAEIAVYSSANLALGIYSIQPDAQTGIYRRKTLISLSHATSEALGERACGENYPDTILPALLGTEPSDVSPDRIAIISVGNSTSGIETQEFLGAVAIHFFPENELYRKSFQIIQMHPTAPAIEMSFPFLPTDTTTPFAITSNKTVSVKRSFADDDTIFSSACPSDGRSIFMKVLRGANIDLFQMMEEEFFHVYPQYGLVTDYPAQGFIQIDIAPAVAPREPEFKEGDTIQSINGQDFLYATLDNPLERAGILNRAQVVRIDEEGRLIVQFNQGPELVVMQPWLIDVVPA